MPVHPSSYKNERKMKEIKLKAMPKLKEFVKRAVGADGLEGHFVVCSSKA